MGEGRRRRLFSRAETERTPLSLRCARLPPGLRPCGAASPPAGVGVAPQSRGASKWRLPFASLSSGAQSRAGVVTSLTSRWWQGLSLPPRGCLGPSEVCPQPSGLRRGREAASAPLRCVLGCLGTRVGSAARNAAAEAGRVPRSRGAGQLYPFFQNHR